MSEILGYLVLALTASSFVGSIAAEIHHARHRDTAVVQAQHDSGVDRGFRSIEIAAATAASELADLVRYVRRKTRHIFCLAVHGRHELYRARTDTRLFQQCLICGYETAGWTIDRRDRRLHLVSHNNRRMPKAS